MTKPSSCLKALTATLMRLARKGDVEGIRAWVRSEATLCQFFIPALSRKPR